MSLIELMIAMLVLLVGLVATMSLVAIAMSGNGRSRKQSGSTATAEMVVETISAPKASISPVLALIDCTGVSGTIDTAAGGAPLTSTGQIDYSQAAVAGYQMNYTDCNGNGTANAGRQTTYDVRWNIQQVTPYVKLLVVSAKQISAGTDLKLFALPVTIRTVIGQGT